MTATPPPTPSTTAPLYAPESGSGVTPSQTVGPFFANCLLRDDMRAHNVLVTPDTEGTRIRIVGYVYDGDGTPLPDALVEIWQANAAGRYNHPEDAGDAALDPTFKGWGRSGTDTDGTFRFDTIKPGRAPYDDDVMQAPHICVAVFARGLLNHLYTRIYFSDEPSNEQDPVLQRVPPERRATLIARHAGVEPGGRTMYTFNVVLQGQNETAFFNI
ncbi:MAG TPA: protocatechuate 3,4-dioxygenase subunit alpha [Chloroflexia bacterium]|nr:protocatechuate 3,4-dioxygenase subunit alpha [Chloroflexia bacterium]